MKYIIKYSNNQKGGNFPLYTVYTRLDTSLLKANILVNLIQDSIRLNRYYHSYYDHQGKFQKEGIHSAIGPEGFNMQDFDTQRLGIDQYESTIIYDDLIEINRLLEPLDLKTVQSGISYWESDVEFSDPYFQLPWIEFIGKKETIPILKMIVNHPLANHYLSSTFTETDGRIRTCLLRNYIDDEGNQINGIDDSEFWQSIKTIITDVTRQPKPVFDITKNDPELDISKEWFILNPHGKIVKIENKSILNPFNLSIPLSTLNVRYQNDKYSFMIKQI